MKPRYFLYFIAIHLLTMASHPPLWGQMESPTKGRWMDFPGEREAFLEVEDNPSLNLKSQMTIELWVYPRRLPQLPQPRWQLVKKGDAYNLAIWSTGIPGKSCWR